MRSLTTAKSPCVLLLLYHRSCVVYLYSQAEEVNPEKLILLSCNVHSHHYYPSFQRKPFISTFVRTALSAEWQPADGSKWVEKDFEKDIQKLEKEAEERLDKKIAELKENIATVGKP